MVQVHPAPLDRFDLPPGLQGSGIELESLEYLVVPDTGKGELLAGEVAQRLAGRDGLVRVYESNTKVKFYATYLPDEL